MTFVVVLIFPWIPSMGADFNGDGIHDFIVGAYKNNDGKGRNAGAAYIFFGAAGLGGTKSLGRGQSADVTILGKARGDRLGISVASAGDVNGDAIDDFIVGAYKNDDGGNNAGAAYIFFGAAGLGGTKDLGGGQSADITILGKAARNYLGYSVSGAGNVNDDSYDDILVGAFGNSDAGAYAGAAYIFFGSTSIGGTKSLGGGQSADVTILAKDAHHNLGITVAKLGNVNAGSIDDFIVGAFATDEATTYSGAAYVFRGKSSIGGTIDLGVTAPDVEILGKHLTTWLSYSISGAGDVNNDGFNDIIIGAFGGRDQPRKGRAYIFFGASNFFSSDKDTDGANVTIIGKAAADRLGISVSGAGDINNDGIDDVIVGAYRNDDGASNAGAAYIFFGASDISGNKNLGKAESADMTVLGKSKLDQLGVSVSAAGDLNNDGIDDLVIGSFRNDDGKGKNPGAAYVFFGAGGIGGTKDLGRGQSADVTILGKARNNRLGRSVGGN